MTMQMSKSKSHTAPAGQVEAQLPPTQDRCKCFVVCPHLLGVAVQLVLLLSFLIKGVHPKLEQHTCREAKVRGREVKRD